MAHQQAGAIGGAVFAGGCRGQGHAFGPLRGHHNDTVAEPRRFVNLAITTGVGLGGTYLAATTK